jgi:hypothetical protein
MCGCKASQFRTQSPSTAPAPPRARPAPSDDIVLRYIGKMSLLVKGRVSGRAYALRPGARINCDRRDASAFLASPLFKRLNEHR